MSFKSSFFIFTSQDNKRVLVGREDPQKMMSSVTVSVRDVQGFGAPSSAKPPFSISLAGLGLAHVCIDVFEWDQTSLPRGCIFSLWSRGDLPDTPQTDQIAATTLHQTA